MKALWTRCTACKTGRLLLSLAVLAALTMAGRFVFAAHPSVIHSMLPWNLFLAALPLLFALRAARRIRRAMHWGVTAVLLLLWLVFYPNAPYMLSDFIHVGVHSYWAPGSGFLPDPMAWLGLLHIVVGVLAGCLCGMLSLYTLHRLVATRWGGRVGWLFVLAVALLGGVGIHLGRFMRFNTWDLVTRPWTVFTDLLVQSNRETLALYAIFAAFTLLPYLLFYAVFQEPGQKS